MPRKATAPTQSKVVTEELDFCRETANTIRFDSPDGMNAKSAAQLYVKKAALEAAFGTTEIGKVLLTVEQIG